ncbi:hypothetical protein SCUP515_01617 [Seiridium cupressi]
MEPLAALSLACNVIQIVATSYSVLRAVKELRAHEGGLTTFSEDLRTLGSEIQKSIESQDPASLSPDEKDILKQATNMVKVAGDLRTELDKFKASKRGIIINAARYLVKKQKIESLEKSLEQIDKFMSTRLLVNAGDTASAKQTLLAITEQEQKIKEHIDPGFATNLEHMYHQSTETRIMLTKQSDQTRAAVYTETGKLHETLEAQISLMKINISTSDVKEFIGSLRFDEMNQRRNAQTLEHSEGTFEWIFESFEDADVESESEEETDQTDDDIEDESSEYGSSASEELDYDGDWKYNVNGTPRYQGFCQWLLNEQQLFWISGKAGSGKSTLMRFLVDDGRTSAALNRARPGNLMLHAFIWNPGTDMQKSEKGIMCTLLHQVLSADPRAAAKLLNSYAQNIQKLSHHDWSVRELRSTLKQAVTLLGRRVCVFVDGLDEAEKLQGDASSVLHLVEFLRTMTGSKLCVSSRPEPVFEKSLQYYPHMRLQDLTYNDIRTFTSNQIFSVRWSYSEYERKELVRRVADSADGVFLWVRLILNSVLKGITNSDDWELLVEQDKGRSIREDFKMDWGDVFECYVANEIAFDNVIRPRWDIITPDKPTEIAAQIMNSLQFGLIPDDEEDKCLHILHNELQNVPGWQDGKRSFTELLVSHGCIFALKGFARSDMEESLRHEERRNRLLRLVCQMYPSGYSMRGYEELISWILSKNANPNWRGVSSRTNSNSAWLDFLFTTNSALSMMPVLLATEDQPRFHAIAAQFHTRGADMDSRHVLGASVRDERVTFGFDAVYEDKIFAVIETTSGYCSRCIFHDYYGTLVEKWKNLHVDISTLAWLVDASLPRIKVRGLINQPQNYGSFTAKKIEYSIELDQSNVRRDGLPGSSDIEYLKGALDQRQLEMLWNETTEAAMDSKQTLHWLVECGCLSPSALKLELPEIALMYGHRLLE